MKFGLLYLHFVFFWLSWRRQSLSLSEETDAASLINHQKITTLTAINTDFFFLLEAPGDGVLPILVIWGGSARKGYFFQASRIWKGRDFISWSILKVGKSVILACKKAKKGLQGHFMDVEETRKLAGLVIYSNCIKKMVHFKATQAHRYWQFIIDQFSCACIRSVLEHACQSFHHLPAHLSDQMEQIIENYPKHTYRGALVLSGLTTFFVRQEQFCNNLFNQIVGSEG